jgi:hypothetical protein
MSVVTRQGMSRRIFVGTLGGETSTRAAEDRRG